ncbi:mycothione reductase [Streptomyces sp. Je 1-369]|uniref:mycothione reductase n=1 Tax=Streptomyces sp. Je 1-369 TaxID=2966192 RepID=UPI00228627BE|nr:mycothione reductase [Streptomyces sp. Je 1-369]WAL93768.1 mycothione reductase [Streptomyces sp. Je 1-369]
MRHHDLLVLGVGSGNVLIDDRFSHLDVAVVAEGPFGGTCLNAGCIPSKMLAVTAEVADGVREAGRHDVWARSDGVDWSAVQERVFDRLDSVSRDGEEDRRASDFVTVYRGRARFTGERELLVETADGTATLCADRIVVAAGGRPVVPPPVADSGLPYETSDTVMRLDGVPERMVVLGGGYIAAELAHVFHTAGTSVTVVEKKDTLLAEQDESVASAFTDIVRDQYDLRLGRELVRVEGSPGRLRLTLDDGSVIEADTLLVAVGREPNSDTLDLDKAGITCDDSGMIEVDAQLRTGADGVWALGDIITGPPLKHVANREAEIVAHNLLHPDEPRTMSYDVVPAAVFTRPQIAQVGITEQEARGQGTEYVVGTRRYEDVAYGWALEESQGFCKVLADPESGRLLGAHVLGPQAATLVQPLVLAMTFGLTARDVAERPLWIHPALTEVVENALRDVEEQRRSRTTG